jgi:ATP-dependent RNA helicase RhlE
VFAGATRGGHRKVIFYMSEVSSRPEAGFSQFHLRSSLLRGIEELGFTEPRPIQAETIPEGLAGHDVLGLAQTGTGKTAAFALPILERLLAKPRPGARALIVVPTRELAMQILNEVNALAKFTEIKAITIYGGVPSPQQIRGLKGKPDILIACPGRLLDLYGQGFVNLDYIETLVLDEADRMFDMGFLPDLKRILRLLPKKRQNLMFSATMPAAVRSLADEVLDNPHVVELAHSMPAETIEHSLYIVRATQKAQLLRHLLAQDDFRSAIVFLRTKHRTKRLALQLSRAGHEAVGLEGNMTQSQRDKAMTGFREGKYDVLVATDVAARGIDVANVSHVINFDVPGTPDDYTHRVGRTGRAEKSGMAVTFAAVDELPGVHAIERKLKSKIPRLELPEFGPEIGPVSGAAEHMVEKRAADRPGGRESSRRAEGSGGSERPRRRTGGPRRSEGARGSEDAGASQRPRRRSRRRRPGPKKSESAS